MQDILVRHELGRRKQRVGRAAAIAALTSGLITGPVIEAEQFGFCHWAGWPGDPVAARQLLHRETQRRREGVSTHRDRHRDPLCVHHDRARHSQREGHRPVLAPHSPSRPAARCHRPSSAHRQRTRISSDQRSPRRSPRNNSPISGPRPARRITTRSANGSKAPHSMSAGVPRSIGPGSRASVSSKPRSTRGSSTTTPPAQSPRLHAGPNATPSPRHAPK